MSTANTSRTRSAKVRERVGHPIIDSDGHVVEFEPALLDYIRDAGGVKILERYKTAFDTAFYFRWNHLTPAERREQRAPRPVFWPYPAKNTYDRATAALPRLLYQRLDEMGLDFTILNPSQGLFAPHIEDEELRRAVCRGFNNYHAEIFREYADRITPAACVPMHTPAEAIAESGARRAARLQGRDDGRIRQTPDSGSRQTGAGNGSLSHLDGQPLPRQRIRLRSGLGQMYRAEDHAIVPFVWPQLGDADVDLELHVQPDRPFRGGRRRDLQGALSGRRDAALPPAQVRFQGGRRRLGGQSLLLALRALAQAESQNARPG